MLFAMHPAGNRRDSAATEGDVGSHKSTQKHAGGWGTATNYTTAKYSILPQVYHTTTTAEILQPRLKID